METESDRFDAYVEPVRHCDECGEDPITDDEKHASERGQDWVCAKCRLCSDCRKVERTEGHALCETCLEDHEASVALQKQRDAYEAYCDDREKEQREERGR